MTSSKPKQMRLNNRQFVRCVSPSQKEGQFLKEETACKDYRFFEVDLMGIETPEDLMNKIASALNFPSYFGGNWDAFLDMISDLTWNPAPGYVVLLKSGEALLQLPGGQLAIFIRLCVAAVERWQSGEDGEGKAIPRTPFYFLLEGQTSFCRLIADLMTNT